MSQSFQRTICALLLLTVTCVAWQTSEPTMADGIRLKREQRLAEAAAIFRSILKDQPGNVDAMVQLATVEGWQKHYDESIRLWEKAWSLRPLDADIGIGLARVHHWKGENAQAAGVMKRVLSENPKYLDALMLMGDIHMAGNSPEEARKFYLHAQEVDPNAPGLAKKIEGATAPLRWRFDTGFSGDNYSQTRGREYTAFSQLGYKLNPRTTVWLRHDYFNHFKMIDNTLGFGATLLVTKPLALTTEINISPHPDFQPKWKFYLGGDYIVHPKLTLNGSYRRWRYPQGTVNIFAPGLRWQTRPWLAAMLKYNISRNIDGSATGALQTQLDFQVHEQVQLYGGFASGEENIPPQAQAIFKTYSTGVIWNPQRKLGLRLDYSFERRRGFYDRHSIGPGVRISF
ncbi:MAG TPA: YaiO family outer membrane beta-barrel protein [Terriglobales bacterium]|nr:YaiO family outer membrane beta-barrel protein [Terriglobales bacterium]